MDWRRRSCEKDFGHERFHRDHFAERSERSDMPTVDSLRMALAVPVRYCPGSGPGQMKGQRDFGLMDTCREVPAGVDHGWFGLGICLGMSTNRLAATDSDRHLTKIHSDLEAALEYLCSTLGHC